MRQYLLAMTLVIGSISTLVGCGSGDKGADMLRDSNKTNIHRLGNLYHMYQSQHGWVGPGSIEEFKTFIGSLPSNRLEMLGVDPNEIDALFVSERDGEAYTFRFDVPGAPRGAISPVVFEQTGTNGSRMVGFTGMRPKEIDDEDEFEELLAGNYEQTATARPAGARPEEARPN